MKPQSEYEVVKLILIKHNALNKTLDEVIDLDTKLYHDLFSYFSSDGEMPYGIQKAREGMPDEWIADRLLEMELIKD
jgi:hypothetical protein|tara:strand:- start:76 stop:306 length:231 start_codon:yes stop_codon:yes gene_type:complete